MVLEHAVLDVVPGQEAAFEEAFAKAKAIISASAGFRSLSACLHKYMGVICAVRADHNVIHGGSIGESQPVRRRVEFF